MRIVEQWVASLPCAHEYRHVADILRWTEVEAPIGRSHIGRYPEGLVLVELLLKDWHPLPVSIVAAASFPIRVPIPVGELTGSALPLEVAAARIPRLVGRGCLPMTHLVPIV